MAAPVPVLRIDWANAGAFDDAIDRVHPLDDPALSFTRGRSGDFTAEAGGQLTFALDNTNHAYAPDRNWCDNPSFERNVSGWNGAAATGLLAAAGATISRVADVATGTGAAAGEVVCPAATGAGVAYLLPYRFRAGQAYSFTVWAKRIAGATGVEFGLGAFGPNPYTELALEMPESATPADVALAGGTITGSWAAYSGTWTPRADTSAARIFARTTGAAATTFRIDAIGVNPGPVPHAFLEAPTRGQLVPGRPVHLYATHSGINWPLFYGYIERITPDLQGRKVTITVYDVLRRLAETDVVVPASSLISRTARDFRIGILEDFERGNLNLLPNPHFATDTAGWVTVGGSLSRSTVENAPVTTGATCGVYAAGVAQHTVYAPARHVPMVFAGQTYRATVYLRLLSGNATWQVGLGGLPWVGSPVGTFQTVKVGAAWTKITLTHTAEVTTGASANYDAAIPFSLSITAMGAGMIEIDGASITRGQGEVPFASQGSGGRFPNLCGNGSMDAGLNGWFNGWTNLCGNPSFETDASGWSATADAFHTAGSTITRVVGASAHGAAYGAYTYGFGGSGFHYALAGTFLAGVTYVASCWLYAPSAGGGPITTGLGSNGVPADSAAASASPSVAATWYQQMVTWTPTADRTDVHFFFATGRGDALRIDAVTIAEADPAKTWAAASVCAWTPPVATRGCASYGLGSAARYGAGSQAFTTLPLAGSGRLYDFAQIGTYFVAGQQYVASAWLRAPDAMPYTFGIGGSADGVTWDTATASGTLAPGQWTQVSVTWTPTADRPNLMGAQGFGAVIAIAQADAIARTVQVDGVRVIPGALPDAFEQPYWDVPAAAEPDVFATSAYLAGSAASCLATLNAATLSRHWIVADMAPPYWRYRVQDRDSFARAAAAETITDGQAMTPPEIDRQPVTNLVPVAYAGGTVYEADGDSALVYGTRPVSAIGGGLYANPSIGITVADALLARYSRPIRRPRLTVENRWPSQLARDVGDAIWTRIDGWMIRDLFGSIATLTTTVDHAGQHWTTEYQLEESAGADGGYGSLAAALPE